MAITLLRRPDVEKTTGLRRSTIYTMMAGGAFLKPIRIGKRAVAWRAYEVQAWIEAREAA